MTQKKWALRPGEPMLEQGYKKLRENKIDKQYEELVLEYIKKSTKRPIVLNDNKEVVYFITYGESPASEKIDVAIYDGFEYEFMPEKLAQKLCTSYLYYVDMMAEAYEYMEFKEEV